jgi:hypothetical protein
MPAARGGAASAKKTFVNGWLLKTFINDPHKDATANPPTRRTIDDLVWTVPGFHETLASYYLYTPGFPQAQCTAVDNVIACDTGGPY